MTKFVAVLLAGLCLAPVEAKARPPGCPSLWCACWACIQLGHSAQECKRMGLWSARGFLKFAQTALQPGTWAVFRRGKNPRNGHVGKVVAVAPGKVLLHSGNDGGAVRTRWRSTQGLIAAVNPYTSYASHKAAKPVRVAKRSKGKRRAIAVRHHVVPSLQYAHAAS